MVGAFNPFKFKVIIDKYDPVAIYFIVLGLTLYTLTVFPGKSTGVGGHCLLQLINLTKIKHKEQILKAAREKQQITHKGIPIRITDDLSLETLQARREGQDILKEMKENNLQPRLLYPARISFKEEGEIKSFTDKQKL